MLVYKINICYNFNSLKILRIRKYIKYAKAEGKGKLHINEPTENQHTRPGPAHCGTVVLGFGASYRCQPAGSVPGGFAAVISQAVPCADLR